MSGVDIAGLVERLGELSDDPDLRSPQREVIDAAAAALLAQAAELAEARRETERLRGRLPCETSTLGQSVYNLLKLTFARDPKAEVKVAGTCGVALIAHLEAQERALFEDAKAYAEAAKLQRLRAESAERERDEALAALKASEWQQIKTAPTDYTHVIGMDATGAVSRTWFYAPSSMTRNWLKVPGGGKWKPLYWLPLREPELGSGQILADATNNPPSDPGAEQREAGV